MRGRGNRRIGYIPQQRPLPPETALRGRDLVALGVDGHRFGLPFPRRGGGERIDRLIDAVGARDFADDPVGLLSGGEQQRLRVGQALADDPRLLLCDEPLTSLDLANQQAVVGLIDRHRRETGAAVLLVTHDINPVLAQVDRILYLANGRFMLGRPDEVLDSRVLTDLYGAPVFVLRAGNRLVVVGAPGCRGVASPPRARSRPRRGRRMNWADIWDAMFGGIPVYGEILGLVWNAVARRCRARASSADSSASS